MAAPPSHRETMNPHPEEDTFLQRRETMVRTQIEARGVRDLRVLAAMRQVPRHRFVPASLQAQAYDDFPLPIGHDQTISQPYIVAFMAEALQLRAEERALEIGSGCGYAAAVLSRLCLEVCGIELEGALMEKARGTLADLDFGNIRLCQGDGRMGWPEEPPFDAILLSCATPEIPEPLWEQLEIGGRILYPKGRADDVQELVLVTKTRRDAQEAALLPVRFVPLREP